MLKAPAADALTSLCRFYEDEGCFVSNLYALACTLTQSRTLEFGENSMRVIPVDRFAGAADGAVRPQRFWQRLARMLDDYLADRTKRAVPEAAFGRSRHEIDRCRRLMHKGSLTPAHSRVACVSPHRVARAARLSW